MSQEFYIYLIFINIEETLLRKEYFYRLAKCNNIVYFVKKHTIIKRRYTDNWTFRIFENTLKTEKIIF